jgi:transcriptional regulator with XRE-family HTH domain
MTSGALLAAELRRRLAANVRRLRLAASLTVKQAAWSVELHWRHWQKVEAGKNNATLATIIRIASALDVTPAELLAEPPPSSEAPGAE